MDKNTVIPKTPGTPLFDPAKVKSAKPLTPLEMNGIQFGDRHTLISAAKMEGLSESANK